MEKMWKGLLLRNWLGRDTQKLSAGDGNVSYLDRDLHLFNILSSWLQSVCFCQNSWHSTLKVGSSLCVKFASKNKMSENKHWTQEKDMHADVCRGKMHQRVRWIDRWMDTGMDRYMIWGKANIARC